MKKSAGLLALLVLLVFSGVLLPESSLGGEGDSKYPSPDEFIKVDRMPETIHQATPEYPSEGKKVGLQGTVRIKSLVDCDGSVVRSLIAESSGAQLLDKAALKAADACRYTPALLDGKPVAVWVQYKTDFVLDDTEPMEIRRLSRMPEFIYQQQPTYPPKALKAGIEGTVKLRVLVSETGEPIKIKVVESSCDDCGFNEAAVEAAGKHKFKPGTMDDRPIAAWITYDVVFKADRDAQ